MTNLDLTKEISRGDLGLISLTAGMAIKNKDHDEFISEMVEQLHSAGPAVRRRFSVEIVSELQFRLNETHPSSKESGEKIHSVFSIEGKMKSLENLTKNMNIFVLTEEEKAIISDNMAQCTKCNKWKFNKDISYGEKPKCIGTCRLKKGSY
jgi:hypothetical protein